MYRHSIERRTRRRFVDGVLSELRARYGDHAAAVARESLAAPDRLDPIGAAREAGIATLPTPRHEREAAVRWARAVGIDGPRAGLDPAVMSD